MAQDLKTEEEKQKLYVELKSGAESGWDYSTRWFVNNNTNKGELYGLLDSIVLSAIKLNDLCCHEASLDW